MFFKSSFNNDLRKTRQASLKTIPEFLEMPCTRMYVFDEMVALGFNPLMLDAECEHYPSSRITTHFS